MLKNVHPYILFKSTTCKRHFVSQKVGFPSVLYRIVRGLFFLATLRVAYIVFPYNSNYIVFSFKKPSFLRDSRNTVLLFLHRNKKHEDVSLKIILLDIS